MAPRPLPEQAVLLQLLRYDARTGSLFWRRRESSHFRTTDRYSADEWCARWNSRYADKRAFTSLDEKGYLRGRIYGTYYRAHRIIWKMVTGREPGPEIDHRDGNVGNNRFENLLSGTKAMNQKNTKQRSDNSTGRTGVYRHAGGWQARIHVENKTIALGKYATFEEAAAARKAGEEKYGYSSRHGTLS